MILMKNQRMIKTMAEINDRQLAVRYAKAAQELLEENKSLKVKLDQQASLIEELETFKLEHSEVDPDLSLSDASYEAHQIVVEAKKESKAIIDDLGKRMAHVLRLVKKLERTTQEARETTMKHYDEVDKELEKIVNIMDEHLGVKQ